MVVMDKLLEWREGDRAEKALVYTPGHQFTVQQKLVMGGHAPMTLLDPDARGTFMLHLRNTVFMVVYSHAFEFADESVWEPCVLHITTGSMTQKEEEERRRHTVCIRGKKGMKRDKAGRQ